MRIKEVEDLVGITSKNIRFYEKEGLLSPGREKENSYRDYSEADVKRLQIIKLLRKLDMPISGISDVLEGRIALPEALHLHALLLEEQRRGIANAQRVCRILSEEGTPVEALDPARYLEEIARGEENSTELVNIPARDTEQKTRETVIVSIVIVALLLVLAVFLVSLSHSGSLSSGIVISAAAIIGIVAIGVGATLIERVRELRRGEKE